jgi:hypothetical protein
MKYTITTETGESLTHLFACGDNMSTVDGSSWVVQILGQHGNSVLVNELADEVFTLYVRHHKTEALKVETADRTRRIYPAGRWPILSVTRDITI